MSLLHLGWAYFRHRLILPCAAGGIALGVAVLFAVLAVFQGFLAEFERSIREFSGDLVVQAPPFGEADEDAYREVLAAVPGIASAQPRLNWFGLVGRRGARALDDPRTTDLSGLLIMGSDAAQLRSLHDAGGAPVPPLAAGELLLGGAAAERLGLEAGDALEVISFRGTEQGAVPVRRSFRLAGTFATGRFDQDLDRAVARRADVAALARVPSGFTEWSLRTAPGIDAQAARERVQAAFAARLPPSERPRVLTWRSLGGNFLRAAEDQKGILAAVFSMIILVAAYQLVATLLLTVTEKRRDIGVLGALGAAPRRIVGFFVSLGLLIALIGCAAGLALGAWLVAELETVDRWLGGGEPIFVPEVYRFEQIPAAVEPGSTLVLLAATLAAAVLFSLIPAWRAARAPVVDALQRR